MSVGKTLSFEYDTSSRVVTFVYSDTLNPG